MNLSQLTNTIGAHKRPKRIGCGPGSGHGKTSCRGNKGQFARTGKSRRLGFEGGQMPLYRRMPKRGFHNIFQRNYGIINLDTLNRFSEGTDVTPEVIYAKGLVKQDMLIKILGSGKLERKLTITAHSFSKSAKAIIEKSGSSWRLVSGRQEDINKKREAIRQSAEDKKKKPKTEKASVSKDSEDKQKPEDAGQKKEEKKQKQKSETPKQNIENKKSEDKKQKTEDKKQKLENKEQKKDDNKSK